MSGDSLEERIRCLASLREESGYMSEYAFNNEKQRHEMVEYNCPILLCMDRYPILRELERQMIEKLVQAKAHREEERVSGLYKCTYQFSEAA
jgi:predicted ArsR family transcriptional regulator